jgi:hypothetical protein
MTIRSHLLFASVAIGALFANAANAVPITLYGSYSQSDGLYDAADDRGQLTCSLGCSGLTSSLVSGPYDANVPDVTTQSGFSADSADLFYLGNNSDSSELAFVNAVLNPDVAAGTRTDTFGLSSYTFTSSALYLLLKIGASPDVALIKNTSGLAQTYWYLPFPKEGAGLSHITEYGGTTSVPEPETFLLLAPGILAMALRLRRRKVAATA